jgi:hypothetical protein
MSASYGQDGSPAVAPNDAVARGGIWEWLWRGAAVAAAKRSVRAELSTLEHEYRRRAELAAELADRALDPVDSLRAGSSVPLALSLYREAAYWALLANGAPASTADLRQAFEAVPAATLRAAAGGDAQLSASRAALVDKNFVANAADHADIVWRDAHVAREFVRALIVQGASARERLERARLQRLWRLGFLVVLLLAGSGTGALRIQRALEPPDLARGKPFRTSSKWMDCHPERQDCGGTHTSIMFHTLEEKEPWFELDLGKPQRFARVEVVNRSDCCPDRAIPLVLEVGNDPQHFRAIAKRKQPFSEWDVEFAPVTARYVRLRVTRRSTLHLERVSVRAK